MAITLKSGICSKTHSSTSHLSSLSIARRGTILMASKRISDRTTSNQTRFKYRCHSMKVAKEVATNQHLASILVSIALVLLASNAVAQMDQSVKDLSKSVTITWELL